MPEYAKMKNADLETLLKSRGLPTGGKKADMVERLTTDDDENKQSTDAPSTTDASSKPTVQHPEDEIDWDDDEEVPAVPAATAAPQTVATTSTTITPTTDAAITATTIDKAGGEGVIDNPQAVPNQVADIDPSQTDDLSVIPPTEAETTSEEKKEPPPDYTRGLAASSLDEEIEKRKARAKKFGLDYNEDPALKKLERARKFGENGPPAGLDEALPERTRKRGREDVDEGRGGDKRRGGGGRFGGRRGGRGNGDRRRNDDRDTRDTRDNRDNRDNRDSRRNDRSRANGGPSNWMSDADKAKADARKAKFAKTTS